MKYNKYFVYKKQVSNDGGQTWADTDPLETTPSGDPIASFSSMSECESANYKLYGVSTSGHTFRVNCNGSTTLSVNEIPYKGGIKTAIIGNCVTNIGNSSFLEEYNLETIVIPNGVTKISNWAFNICRKIGRIVIPDSVKSIGEGAFTYAGNESVIFGSGLTSIGDTAFRSSSGVTYVPTTVEYLGESAFQACHNLTSVSLPNIKELGSSFCYCLNLTAATIGSGITKINECFQGCKKIRSVTIYATTPPMVDSYIFYGTNNNFVIYVPRGSVNAYKSASGWNQYASKIQAIP